MIIINPYRFVSSGGGSYDSDAEAYFTAYGITDVLKKSAINQFVLSLKSANLWTNTKGIWFVAHGNASQNAGNLRSPGTHTITHVNSPTHASTGMQFNGTTQYVNFNMQADVLAQNANYLALYSRSNISQPSTDMGAWGPTVTKRLDIELYGGAFYSYNNTDGANSYITGNSTRTDRFFISTRTASNAVKGYRDGAEIATGTFASVAPSTLNLYGSCVNFNGTPTSYASKEITLWMAGSIGLTPTDATNMTNAVNTLMTSLSLNV